MANNELIIQDFGINYQPPILTISNYEALQQQLSELLKDFNGLVVTDENLKSVEQTKTNLKKLKDEFNNKRKQVKREYNIPYDDFKRDIDGLISQVDQVFVPIDNKIKVLKEKQREERKQHVLELISGMSKEYGVKSEDVPFNEKWTNKSLSKIQLTRDISDALKTVKREQDLAKANQQLIIDYAKANGMSETDSWLQLLVSGKDVQEIKALIDSAAQKKIDEAEHKKKQKEAEEAIAKANQVTLDDGKVVDKTTGEVVQDLTRVQKYEVTMSIIGTRQQFERVREILNENNIEFDFGMASARKVD